MKNLNILFIPVLLCVCLLSGTATAQNYGLDKDKKSRKENPGNQGQDKGKANNRKNDKPEVKNDRERADKGEREDGAKPEREKGNQHDRANTRTDRDKDTGMQKITICHKTAGADKSGVTITISERAWKAHEAHGDVRGACPEVNTGPKPVGASGPVFKKRTDFYEKVTKADEKIYDAEDLLEAARDRMRKAQARLETARKNKTLPPADIERQEANIARTSTLIAELESLVQETRGSIRAEVEEVEVNVAVK